jgi:hypothetical protein
VLLTWTEASADHDGNRLEVGTPDGTFQQIGDLIVGGGVILQSQSDIPELLVLTFRLTAMRQGAPIGPPATVQFTEPLRALLAAANFTGNGIQLGWSTTSTVADRVEVTRSHHRLPSTLPVEDPSAAGSYPVSQSNRVDTDVVDAMTYVYTLTLKAGQVSGEPVFANADIPFAAPTDAIARVHAGSVELTWINHSQAGTEIQVLRGPGLQPGGSVEIVAHLPPDAGSYREQAPGPGQYTYTIAPQVPVYGPANIRASVDVLPASSPFDTELLSPNGTVPGGYQAFALRHSTGEWLLCGSAPIVFALPPYGPDAGVAIAGTQFAGDFMADPCLMLDSTGRPHGVFSAAGTLYHASFDGSGWVTEEIASRPFGFSALLAALDSHDAVHAVWLLATPSPDAGFEYAHRGDAGWVTESIPDLAVGPDAIPRALAVDRDDTVHVVWLPRLEHLQRAPAGTWNLEQIPVALTSDEAITDSVFFPDLATGPAVLFIRALPSSQSIELTTLDAGTWSNPELVTSMQRNGGWLITATSPDGTRLAASVGQGPPNVFVRGDAGWTNFDLGAASPAWVLGVALDDQDRLHWIDSVGYQFFERFDETP